MQAQPAKVLVVDDDPAIREVLRGVLEEAGYRVDAAEDGPVALDRLSARGIDLVLLDLMLPGMDGREVCRQVRLRSRGLYLPIIMVTALAAPEQRHEGFLGGADDYVTKPFAIDDVLDRVGVWLRMRERLRVAAEQRYADTEAALVLARTPLQVLLNLVRAWEAQGADTSELAPVRAELEQTVQAVAAQMDHLGRMLRDE
ncbi:MAG TPA: response regulator [Chloroflexota bacterium]|jgi:DNA-binding response OmpR family regulator